MALINCPECGKEISGKSQVCIHCGYPIQQQSEKLKNIISRSSLKGVCVEETNLTLEEAVRKKEQLEHKLEHTESGIKERTPGGIIIEWGNLEYEIVDFDDPICYPSEETSIPTCPRCGSTAISTGARGVNHFWGFIGASKTVNRCAECGHMWEPKG